MPSPTSEYEKTVQRLAARTSGHSSLSVRVDYQRSETLPCECCGKVGETFCLPVDGETWERLCWDGFRDTVAGARQVGGRAIGGAA